MLRLTLTKPSSDTVARTDTAPLNSTSPSLAMALRLLRQLAVGCGVREWAGSAAEASGVETLL